MRTGQEHEHTLHDSVTSQHASTYKYIHILLMPVSLVHTGAVFEGVDKAGDVVRGDGNDKGVGDDCQHADTFENPMPDTCQARRRLVRG